MTTSEQTVTVVGKVVDVYRECEACGDWKPLDHFLVKDGHAVVASLHQCAACRRAAREGSRGGKRP